MDKISKERRSQNMRAIRSKNMKPELKVRSLVHRMGYRFRLHKKDIPGKPDLVFPKSKKIIFVHGCFWHCHAKRSCKIKRIPKSNVEFWKNKLSKNRIRDLKNVRALKKSGWKVLTIWECELEKPQTLLNRIAAFMHDAR